MEGKVRICRLCFTSIEDENFESLDGIRTEMIKIVSIPLNLSISEDPVVCRLCSENLQRCFDFKMTCLNTEDCVKTFVNKQAPFKVDMQVILLKELLADDTRTEEKEQICRLCFNFDSSSYTRADNIEGTMLNEMLEKCVPEMNFNLTTKPLICCNCMDLLKQDFHFVQLCLENEEKIKNYCVAMACASTRKVDLRNVLLSHTDVKIDIEGCELENVVLKPEKIENDNDSFGLFSAPEPTIVLFNSGQSKEIMHSCEQCEYQTQSIRDLKIHYMSHGKGERLYECQLCPFVTLYRSSMSSHKKRHMNLDETDWYECEACEYRTKLKSTLRKHMLKHGTPAEIKWFKRGEVTMYVCGRCEVTSKCPTYIKKHFARCHSGKSAPKKDIIYSCSICDFTTKIKKGLFNHMRAHEVAKRSKVYACLLCPYQTKWKENIGRHKLAHKRAANMFVKGVKAPRLLEDKPEVNSRHDDFEPAKEYSLQGGVLEKRHADKGTTHACPYCYYTAKKVQFLTRHILIRHPNNATIHSCQHCYYMTKYKARFERHRRAMHNDVAAATSYQCHKCFFATKHKRSLRDHLVYSHGEQAQTLKCPQCNFETMRGEYFREHRLGHMRGKVHPCPHCDVKAARLKDLRLHVRTKHSQHATLYSCGRCSYWTKHKQIFVQHCHAAHPAPAREADDTQAAEAARDDATDG